MTVVAELLRRGQARRTYTMLLDEKLQATRPPCVLCTRAAVLAMLRVIWILVPRVYWWLLSCQALRFQIHCPSVVFFQTNGQLVVGNLPVVFRVMLHLSCWRSTA